MVFSCSWRTGELHPTFTFPRAQTGFPGRWSHRTHTGLGPSCGKTTYLISPTSKLTEVKHWVKALSIQLTQELLLAHGWRATRAVRELQKVHSAVMRGEIPLRHTLEQLHPLNCKATKAIKHLGQVYRTGDSAQLAVIQGSSSAKRCSPSTSNCWEGDGVTKVREYSHLE